MGLSWTPAGLLWAHKPIHSPRLYFQQLTHNTQPFFLKIKEKKWKKSTWLPCGMSEERSRKDGKYAYKLKPLKENCVCVNEVSVYTDKLMVNTQTLRFLGYDKSSFILLINVQSVFEHCSKLWISEIIR
jgi:hypothetical protein